MLVLAIWLHGYRLLNGPIWAMRLLQIIHIKCCLKQLACDLYFVNCLRSCDCMSFVAGNWETIYIVVTKWACWCLWSIFSHRKVGHIGSVNWQTKFIAATLIFLDFEVICRRLGTKKQSHFKRDAAMKAISYQLALPWSKITKYLLLLCNDELNAWHFDRHAALSGTMRIRLHSLPFKVTLKWDDATKQQYS